MSGKTMIKVQGYLDKIWEDSFENMETAYDGVYTILTINLMDESHLHGILNLIRDLNLKLISVNSVEEEPNK